MEINEPRAWTLAVLYIKRLSKCMRRVESGTTLDNMAWCRRHIFWLIPMTRKGCIVCVCLRLMCPVGAFHYLGLGTPKLHSFDLSFLDGHEDTDDAL